MASPSSDVDICNLALQRLGVGEPISSLTDGSVEASECNRVYDHARDSELRAYRWNFARARVSLAADTTAPIFGFLYQYTLPADWLRNMTNPAISNLDWQIEGRKILTNDGAPLEVIYLKRVEDPNDFDELFIDLLVSRIAMDIAERITQSNIKIDQAKTRYQDAKATARRTNSFENVSNTPPDDVWVTTRL